MTDTTEKTDTNKPRARRWHRLAWFAALWLAGTAGLFSIAWLIRLVLH